MSSMKMQDRMGYDRSITMFSPDGRLLQVEYAKKTVKQGSTALGITCKDGVVLVADKRVSSKLMIADAIEKTFPIDDHIVTTASGIISDARVLVDRSQLKAQQHFVTYNSKIDVLSIVKDMCDLKQICTQSAGLRPFGVSMLVAGIEEDGSIKLFVTEPYGLYFQYRAAATGEHDTEVEQILEKKWKASITVDQAVKLGIDALKEALKSDFDINNCDVAVIRSDNKKVKLLNRDVIKKLVK
ncbi:proteasome subunit alpha [archaeon]|nr:proteasome subunit alpha [archaeon]